MEEKQKKNRYGKEFYRNITKRAEEKGLFEKKLITSGEILEVIAELAGEDYRPKSGLYILSKWADTVKDRLDQQKKVVFSTSANRNVNSIVFIPVEKEEATIAAKSNEEKRLLIRNIIVIIDKQLTSREGKLWVSSLREWWEGDDKTSGIALLCKASKTLRATFGFGFTYDYHKIKRVVSIRDAAKLREKLIKLMPSTPKEEKKEEEASSGLKLNQFVRITDEAMDAMYLMANVIASNQRGIEIYSLAKYLSEAPSLITKKMSVADIKVLLKSVGADYFTFTNGPDIVNLTVGGWELVKQKFNPENRLIEVLVQIKDKDYKYDDVTMINDELGLGTLITDCTWESFKKLGRLVYSGKLILPVNQELQKKLIADVEKDLEEVAKQRNPFMV